ncbi:MAG: hypothetical protein JRH11_00400 [Deltaproteobacteria bacterium]|nr:hypothetical protein [Deltaproteobacteria bacterium]
MRISSVLAVGLTLLFGCGGQDAPAAGGGEPAVLNVAPHFAVGATLVADALDFPPRERATISLRWPPADDEVGVVAYLVRVDSAPAARVDATVTQTDVTNVDCTEPRTFAVVAVDAEGKESAPIETRDAYEPTFPRNAQLRRHTDEGPGGTATWRLSWPSASDDVGIDEYVVRMDGRVVATVEPDVLEYTLGAADEDEHFYAVTALDGGDHWATVLLQPDGTSGHAATSSLLGRASASGSVVLPESTEITPELERVLRGEAAEETGER